MLYLLVAKAATENRKCTQIYLQWLDLQMWMNVSDVKYGVTAVNPAFILWVTESRRSRCLGNGKVSCEDYLKLNSKSSHGLWGSWMDPGTPWLHGGTTPGGACCLGRLTPPKPSLSHCFASSCLIRSSWLIFGLSSSSCSPKMILEKWWGSFQIWKLSVQLTYSKGPTF